ncbi:hypothetical protein GS876_21105 [Rhodococcus hoagii]|nr:hypothetical protein [Prescottella equi]MBM4687398.1 hypothetical protein [Prescottella equi]MBM4687408.1 hypothetical protein [Prescottella equi]MBM4687415.1 hypothetical protein [Prescottella equi]NKU31586.1 hypothetical protein [Prescottella equi]
MPAADVQPNTQKEVDVSDATAQLVPFQYENERVRVLDIDGEPWFVLTDLCRVLGLGTPSRVRDRLAEGVSQTHTLQTAGGPQQMILVSEPGMYEVVIRSDKPEAARFRRWITAEVLPTIRRTGAYGTPALTGSELMARALVEAKQVLAAKDATIAELAPKAAYVDEFVADEDLIQFRTLANQLQIGETDLRETLIEHGWIYRMTGSRWSNSKGRKETVHQYRAYSDKKHYFRLRPLHKAPRVNGEVRQTLLLTPAGAEAVARNLARWNEDAA